MQNLVKEIRNAARAVIVRDEQLLLLRKLSDAGIEQYALPGGGQEPGETLERALQRECLEEIGVNVEINNLMHVADYFKLRDTTPPSTRHLVEFLFDCSVPDDYEPRLGSKPDKHQVDVVWVHCTQLSGINLLPRSMQQFLHGAAAVRPVYIGEIV